ncbi:MAG: glycoside hydrolase family 15 protein [Rhodospirillales bacterium]
MTASTSANGMALGIAGNSQIAALIDRHGKVVWLCYPRFDSDPIFASLVDANGLDGAWSFQVIGACAYEQRYLRNTAVLETLVRDDRGGILRIIDYCPRFKRYNRIFRPPMLIRRIEAAAGWPQVAISVRAASIRDGAAATTVQGSHHVRYALPHAQVRITTDAPLSYLIDEIAFVVGRPYSFVLGGDEPLPEAPDKIAAEWLEETTAYWIEWVRYLSLPFEWQTQVIRAAITLKLCQYEDTGALVAALTTSIPEAPGSQRNWDYRFCWLRDAFHVVYAFNLLGATRTMEEFIDFAMNAAASAKGPLAPLYPIALGPVEPETEIVNARGFLGNRPVRFGNAAAGQTQNDVYGSVIVAAAQMFFDERLPQTGGWALYSQLVPLGECAKAVALEPDAGIWEYRGRARIHTHSAVMCWAGLDRLARIAAKLGETGQSAGWRRAADDLRDEILRRAWSEVRQSFVGALDDANGGELDGSVLIMPIVGFLPPTDPRFLATLAAIGRDLDNGGFISRYSSADDFGRPETAFVVCSFWYAEALAAAGDAARARAVFERVLSRANHLGIFAEDIAPATGELWGNFPQTYCMAGLVSAAMRLSHSFKEGIWDASS